MSSPCSKSASEAVFTTYELVEGILSHLWMNDLIRAQQVCRYWHSTIAQSQTLRQILFLSPAPRGTIDEVGDPIEEHRHSSKQKWHPLLTARSGRWNRPDDYDDSENGIHQLLNYKTVARLFSLPPGQWEQMFVSQPPQTGWEIALGEHHTPMGITSYILLNPGGVRLTAMVALTKQALRDKGLRLSVPELDSWRWRRSGPRPFYGIPDDWLVGDFGFIEGRGDKRAPMGWTLFVEKDECVRGFSDI